MRAAYFRKAVCAVLPLACVALGALAGEPISVRERVSHPPEMGTVTWYDVSSKLGTFSFIPPADWHLGMNLGEGRLFLRPPDGLANVEIVFTALEAAAGQTNRQETLRRRLEAAYPEVVVLEEFDAYTSASPGHGFDLRWKPAKAVTMSARVVFLPLPNGSIELHLLARPESIKESHHLFGALLTSFQRRAPDDEKQTR